MRADYADPRMIALTLDTKFHEPACAGLFDLALAQHADSLLQLDGIARQTQVVLRHDRPPYDATFRNRGLQRTQRIRNQRADPHRFRRYLSLKMFEFALLPL